MNGGRLVGLLQSRMGKAMDYLWLKAIHAAAAVIWVGGMLVMALVLAALPSDPQRRGDSDRRYLAAGWKWNRQVTSPAMILAWLLGITMALEGGWFAAPWFHAKFALVVALSALHGVQSGMLRRLHKDAHWQGAMMGHPLLEVTRLSGAATVVAVAAVLLLVVARPF